MTTAAESSLNRVRSIVFRYLEGRNVTVYLFGSHARGSARRASDIDVAIDASEPLPPGLLTRLRDELEESTIPYQVDVVDLRDVSPEFRKSVEREGLRWSA